MTTDRRDALALLSSLDRYLAGNEALSVIRVPSGDEEKARSDTRVAAERFHTPPVQRVPSRERVRHAFQLTCQFIRLVCHCLEHRTLGSTPCLYSACGSVAICEHMPDTDGRPPFDPTRAAGSAHPARRKHTPPIAGRGILPLTE